MENREILENLVISQIKRIDHASLSKLYTLSLQLDPSNSKKELKNIKKEDLIAEFLNSKLDISDNTIKNYQSVLSGFLKYTYSNLNKDIVIAYIRKKKYKWSTNTKRRNYIFIKNFLNHLYRFGYLDEDFSDIIPIPKKNKVAQYIPDDNEIDSFFATLKKIYKDDADKLRYSTIFSIYIKIGLRLNELINLNYQDIDFNHSRIYLNHTKNGDKAYMPMDDQLKEIIKDYINRFNIKGGALIKGKGGKRINKNVITNNLRRIVKEAGLPESFTAHAFRRYFIDKQSRSNANVFLLSELARHKDLNTTYGYLKVREEDKRSAISNIKLAV